MTLVPIIAHPTLSGGSDAAEVSTVSFSLPSSDLFEGGIFEGRRALVGGTLSRAYLSFDQGGTTYVLSADHAGSRANPTTWVSTLSGATHGFADLGSTSQTSAEVADAFVAAATGAGVSNVATDGTDANGRTIVTVQGASNLTIPPSVDWTNETNRGMWGWQRGEWGAGAVTGMSNGGTTNTGVAHLGNPGGTGRILGVYFWCYGAHAPRVAVFTGPAYSTSPTALTPVYQGVAPATTGFRMLLFDDPVSYTGSTNFWIAAHDDGGGGFFIRAHGATPTASGDFGASNRLLVDETIDDSSSTAFPNPYTPTVDNDYAFHWSVGLIFEREDASGNYPADGSLECLWGDHNDDVDHGTQFDAGPSVLNDETTHQRKDTLPQWTDFGCDRVALVVNAIGSDEDSRLCMYGPWADLVSPTTNPPDLIADMGLMGLDTAGAYNEVAISPRVELGTEQSAIGANAIVSLGFNYVRDGGSALATYDLPVFLDNATGDGAFTNCWVDNRAEWHDGIPGASGRAPTSSSALYNTDGSTMPHDDTSETWPDPFETDAGDGTNNSIPLTREWWERVGIQEVV